jgi:hypothetical protein
VCSRQCFERSRGNISGSFAQSRRRLVCVPEALPYLERNALAHLVPSWHADLGPISLHYATGTLLPAKPRIFVDFVLAAFSAGWLGRAASLG